MSVKIKIHPYIRTYVNNREEVEVMGHTVGECIDNIEHEFPGLKMQLLKKGKVRDHFEIYVNDESAYPEELDRSVKDGDVITIITYIAGG